MPAHDESSGLSHLESVRRKSRKFCEDREWAQFHTPTNIVLALAGEAGEVAEIFQWKGNLDNFNIDKDKKVFNEAEIEHIGEEISDVMIYTIRLCDIVSLDLCAVLVNKINSKNKNWTRALNTKWYVIDED
jgi:dCTP diphosphatase|tara:strand:+ start:76 stop:468 length:393 start_codon:yes stop_codon:yes gene_type:complete